MKKKRSTSANNPTNKQESQIQVSQADKNERKSMGSLTVLSQFFAKDSKETSIMKLESEDEADDNTSFRGSSFLSNRISSLEEYKIDQIGQRDNQSKYKKLANWKKPLMNQNINEVFQISDSEASYFADAQVN